MPTPYLPHVNATEVTAMMQALRQCPRDDVTRAALADALDEQGPSPVVSEQMPGWLRLCWLRTAPATYKTVALGTSFDTVHRHIRALLNWPYYANPGTAIIAGLECFVCEPRLGPSEAPHVFRPLAALVDCCAHAFSRHGSLDGTVRAILLPPLEVPPPKKVRCGGTKGRQQLVEYCRKGLP